MEARAQELDTSPMPTCTTTGVGEICARSPSSVDGFNVHKNSQGYWHLCDSRTVDGKRRHKVLESYGRERPTLFAPVVSVSKRS